MSSLECLDKLLCQVQNLNFDLPTKGFSQISDILCVFAKGIADLDSKFSNVFLNLHGIQENYNSFKNSIRSFLNKLSPNISTLHRLLSMPNPNRKAITTIVERFPMAELETLLQENYNLIDLVQNKISSIGLWDLVKRNLLRDLVVFACIGGLIGFAFSSLIPLMLGADILAGISVGSMVGCIVAVCKALFDYFSGNLERELQYIKNQLQIIKDQLMNIKQHLEHVQDSMRRITQCLELDIIELIKTDCETIMQEIENIRNLI